MWAFCNMSVWWDVVSALNGVCKNKNLHTFIYIQDSKGKNIKIQNNGTEVVLI
jgi:hypothetical protein